MTREEKVDAVERLNAIKQFIGYDKDSEIVQATQKSLDMAIKALEQEPKWIPVSERLPEKRGYYIVTEKVFSLDDREHKGRFNVMTEQVEWSGEKWKRARFFEVIAWQPLPGPYEAESEDKNDC